VGETQREHRGVWSQITVHEELGPRVSAVEDPTSDLYGGHRLPATICTATARLRRLDGPEKWH